MIATRRVLGGALVAVFGLASAAISGETQPTGPDEVPVTLAAWAEGARLFQQLGDFNNAWKYADVTLAASAF